MSTILDLQPASVWHYFHQLTQIPRPSHHEEAVQQYVLDEAARLGLSAERDAVGNIRVRKPASAGHEGAPGGDPAGALGHGAAEERRQGA
ncbi:hypothetical protein V8H18_01425 [Lautropia mirabilis]